MHLKQLLQSQHDPNFGDRNHFKMGFHFSAMWFEILPAAFQNIKSVQVYAEICEDISSWHCETLFYFPSGMFLQWRLNACAII
jgi:hypothetical protein